MRYNIRKLNHEYIFELTSLDNNLEKLNTENLSFRLTNSNLFRIIMPFTKLCI